MFLTIIKKIYYRMTTVEGKIMFSIQVTQMCMGELRKLKKYTANLRTAVQCADF